MGRTLFEKKLLGRMKKSVQVAQHHHKNGLFGLAAGRMAGVNMLLSVDAGLLNELAQGSLAPAVDELLPKNPLSAAANGDVAAIATTWFPLFCWFSWKSLNEANPVVWLLDGFLSIMLGLGALAKRSVESANFWLLDEEVGLDVVDGWEVLTGAAPNGSGNPEDEEDEVLNLLLGEENELLPLLQEPCPLTAEAKQKYTNSVVGQLKAVIDRTWPLMSI